MAERLYAYVVSAVLIGAVAYPFAWKGYEDSFPLSAYPMFSRRLPTPELKVAYAIGLEDDGERHHLEPELIANDEVLQARAVISRAVGAGRGDAAKLCAHIAERVASRSGMRGVTSVRIVTGTHDAVEFLTGRDRVGSEKVHVACPVRREP